MLQLGSIGSAYFRPASLYTMLSSRTNAAFTSET